VPDGQFGVRKVYKDSAVTALDEFFGGDPQSLQRAFDYASDFLEQSGDLADLTKDAVGRRGGVKIDETQAEHFEEHWDEDEKQEMRRGYKDAIRLATEDGQLVPIETFWVTGENERFQIFARRGERQVTVLVFIPPDVERKVREPWRREERISPDEPAS
jgi:hypothetical protein